MAGATVVGPRPTESPSLADYPHCDSEVQRIGGGSCGANAMAKASPRTIAAKARSFGEGHSWMCWRRLDTPPDFACQERGGERGDSLHPPHVDGDEIYFVASGVPGGEAIPVYIPRQRKAAGIVVAGYGTDRTGCRLRTNGTTAPWSLWRSTPTDRCSWFSVRETTAAAGPGGFNPAGRRGDFRRRPTAHSCHSTSARSRSS